MENSIHSKYEVETTRKYQSYESNIQELRNNYDELNRRYREVEMTARRIPEY